ncbi:MAG TPA: hypothetical protein VKV28_07015 [Candidatus Binataceae bacterium]|nr:hypothetical protein [Candidatus Binataceae bacterium]
MKSFPLVDGLGRPNDPISLGAALHQVSVYLLLARSMVAHLGGDPEVVLPLAMIVTAAMSRLLRILSVKNISQRIVRAQRVLERVPDAIAIARGLPKRVYCGLMSDRNIATERRLEELGRTGRLYRVACRDYRLSGRSRR